MRVFTTGFAAGFTTGFTVVLVFMVVSLSADLIVRRKDVEQQACHACKRPVFKIIYAAARGLDRPLLNRSRVSLLNLRTFAFGTPHAA